MKKYIKMLPILALVAGLSSCLKDKAIIAGDKSNIVEFYTTDPYASSTSDLYAGYNKSFPFSPSDKFTVTVSYSGSDVAPQDITVNLGTDPTAIAKQNVKIIADTKQAAIDAGLTGQDLQDAIDAAPIFTIAPSDSYTIPATVVIKKGERRATFDIAVVPNKYDFDHNYVVPLSIKSTSFGTVSGNFGTVFYGLKYQNPYEGTYASKLHFVRVGLDERFTNVNKKLATTGPRSVSTLYADLGSSYTMILTINADNTVTITPTGSAADGSIPGPFTQDGVNKYDPATKTFTLHYQYRGGARTSEETLTLNP